MKKVKKGKLIKKGLIKEKMHKKAVSTVIGYVILIVIGMIMATIVFNYIKTFTPSDSIECPSDVSLFIQKASCDSTVLTVKMKNNGKFNLYGYFIHAVGENSSIRLATIDLAQMLNVTNSSGFAINSTVYFNKDSSPLKPDEISISSFNLTKNITSLEIIPIRIQDEDFKEELVSCGNIKITEEIKCPDYSPTVIEPYYSGGLCLDEGYNLTTPWLSDYVFYTFPQNVHDEPDSVCGAIGNYLTWTNNLLDPAYFKFNTPNLPFAGNYYLTLNVLRGNQANETYRVECGTKTYEVPDENESIDDWRNESYVCDFNSGSNEVTITGTGYRGSGHYEDFWITSVVPPYKSVEICLEDNLIMPQNTSNNVVAVSGFVTFYQGSALIDYCGVYKGDYGAHNRTGNDTITVKTPSLPYDGVYDVTLVTRRGSNLGEEFELICGAEKTTFPGGISGGEILRNESISDQGGLCNFNEGINYFTLNFSGSDSVHFESFRIDEIV